MIKKILTCLEEIIGGISLSVMAVLVVVNVFMRMFFRQSIPWSEEVTSICYAYVIYVGAASLYKRYGHSSIDIIVKLFPEKMQAVCAVVSTLILTATCGITFVLSCIYCADSMTRRTPLLKLPYAVQAFAITLGFGFMLIHSAMFLKNAITRKDYYHEVPIYKNIIKVESAEDVAVRERETEKGIYQRKGGAQNA